MMTALNMDIALYFRDQFRAARATVLRDSEAYDSVVLVLERLGRLLEPGMSGLGQYRKHLSRIAGDSPLAVGLPTNWPDYHLTFDALFDAVREARNLAVHEGALARHLSSHSVECALVVEDALMAKASTVGEFMVRGPITASPWQPLSFVRQIMLMNSFSYLPVQIHGHDGGQWQLVSDASLARALRDGKDREKRLAMPLADAVSKGIVKLHRARTAATADAVTSLVVIMDEAPVLVVSTVNQELLGILTAFDLL